MRRKSQDFRRGVAVRGGFHCNAAFFPCISTSDTVIDVCWKCSSIRLWVSLDSSFQDAFVWNQALNLHSTRCRGEIVYKLMKVLNLLQVQRYDGRSTQHCRWRNWAVFRDILGPIFLSRKQHDGSEQGLFAHDSTSVGTTLSRREKKMLPSLWKWQLLSMSSWSWKMICAWTPVDAIFFPGAAPTGGGAPVVPLPPHPRTCGDTGIHIRTPN